MTRRVGIAVLYSVRLEKVDDLAARTNVTEDSIERRQRGLVQSVCVPGQSIGHQDHLVLEFGGIACRGFAADVRDRTGNQQRVDSETIELLFQIALAWEKCARTGFARKQVTVCRLEPVPQKGAGTIWLAVIEVLRRLLDPEDRRKMLR